MVEPDGDWFADIHDGEVLDYAPRLDDYGVSRFNLTLRSGRPIHRLVSYNAPQGRFRMEEQRPGWIVAIERDELLSYRDYVAGDAPAIETEAIPNRHVGLQVDDRVLDSNRDASRAMEKAMHPSSCREFMLAWSALLILLGVETNPIHGSEPADRVQAMGSIIDPFASRQFVTRTADAVNALREGFRATTVTAREAAAAMDRFSQAMADSAARIDGRFSFARQIEPQDLKFNEEPEVVERAWSLLCAVITPQQAKDLENVGGFYSVESGIPCVFTRQTKVFAHDERRNRRQWWRVCINPMQQGFARWDYLAAKLLHLRSHPSIWNEVGWYEVALENDSVKEVLAEVIRRGEKAEPLS